MSGFEKIENQTFKKKKKEDDIESIRIKFDLLHRTIELQRN